MFFNQFSTDFETAADSEEFEQEMIEEMSLPDIVGQENDEQEDQAEEEAPQKESESDPIFNDDVQEDEEELVDEDLVYFTGQGISLPDRVQLISNKDYRLGYADNLSKWAVFWFFTFCASGIPYMVQQRDARLYKRRVRKEVEANIMKKSDKK